MVDVRKQVQERIETARETVKGARDTLGEVIARAAKAGREQFQELVAMGDALGEKYEPRIAELAGKVEPRLGELVENRIGSLRGFMKSLNERLAEKSAAPADKPKAASRKAPARKSAAKKATTAKKPATTKAKTASKPAEAEA